MWRKGAQQEQRPWGARGDREVCDTHARLQSPRGQPRGPVLGLQGVSPGAVHPHPGAELQAETGHLIKHQSNPVAPISCDGQTSLLMGGAGPLSPIAGKWAPCKGCECLQAHSWPAQRVRKEPGASPEEAGAGRACSQQRQGGEKVWFWINWPERSRWSLPELWAATAGRPEPRGSTVGVPRPA